MAIEIHRLRRGSYSSTINGDRIEDVYRITGLPSGTQKDEVRALAEAAGAVPDELPAKSVSIGSVPWYADRVEMVADGKAFVSVIYTDRNVFWSGPGVQNTSYGKSSTVIEQIPVWEQIIAPEGHPTWRLRYQPYERAVTHRVYRGIISVSLAQAQAEFEQNFWTLRTFGVWEYLFSAFNVGETPSNQVFAEIEFTRTSKIPAFAVGDMLNDVAIPQLGGLDKYATKGPDYPAVGPPSPPVVVKVDGVDLYDSWSTLSFDVDGVS